MANTDGAKMQDGKSVRVTVPDGIVVAQGEFAVLDGFHGIAEFGDKPDPDGAADIILNIEHAFYDTTQITGADAFNKGDLVYFNSGTRLLTTQSGKQPVAATLLTGTVGANNGIRWTARDAGGAGNGISVRVAVAGNNTALSVVVNGNDIVVNSATDGGGAATSTAAQVIAAIQASAAANALVTVANEGASSGAGVVGAVGVTNLAGGLEQSAGHRLVGRVSIAKNADGIIRLLLFGQQGA